MKLTKKEKCMLVLAGILEDVKIEDKDKEYTISKARTRFNRILLEGVLNDLINNDNVELTKDIVKRVEESLFGDKIISISETIEDDDKIKRTLYILSTKKFTHIEILLLNNKKVCVNPF